MSNNNQKIVLIGKGGHSKVVADIIDLSPGLELYGYLDDSKNENNSDETTLGPISMADRLAAEYEELYFNIAIGDNNARKIIVESLSIPQERYITLIHPSCVVAKDVQIGKGCVLIANTVVNPASCIGDHVILNTSSVIGHDCKLESYVHIAPRTGLTGGVVAEEGSFLGSGASVVPNIRIGKWASVGAGTTVTRNLPSFEKVVGTSMRSIR